ncbi:BRO-N domain-containing protein [Merismopedia glauca]|uniref:Bro-N domain-containing protein n=1 Tax=Merismopedia glauca CCAP 1448/3 TaxID=1296344 RepID=A0A2T1BWH6_9CYAN|nr:BRO family protein [Merismopedia glauca]PSB00370.1 hypothetical protein C7B64_23890 [Merismopedia glauca CCAP 1448/3]
MSQSLTVFEYQAQEVRTIVIDGEPWFVAKDICTILEYSNTSRMLPLVDSEDKQEINPQDRTDLVLSLPSNTFRLTLINESGLYACIFSSHKPQAKIFKKWVTSEVLPSIRQTGGYQLKAVEPTPDEIIRQGCWAVDLILAGVNVKPELVSGIKANLVAKHLPAISTTVEETRQLLINESACEENLLTPTQLGKQIGMSGAAVNKKLVELGLQVRHPKRGKTDPAYIATPTGINYSSVVFATDNKGNSQTTYQSLRWNPSVLELFSRQD